MTCNTKRLTTKTGTVSLPNLVESRSHSFSGQHSMTTHRSDRQNFIRSCQDKLPRNRSA